MAESSKTSKTSKADEDETAEESGQDESGQDESQEESGQGEARKSSSRKPDRGKPDKAAKPSKAHQGWLMFALGDEETALPGGKAVRWAAAVCPDDEAPTVGEVRAAFPESVYVGQSANGEAVSLRSLVAADEDDEGTVEG